MAKKRIVAYKVISGDEWAQRCNVYNPLTVFIYDTWFSDWIRKLSKDAGDIVMYDSYVAQTRAYRTVYGFDYKLTKDGKKCYIYAYRIY